MSLARTGVPPFRPLVFLFVRSLYNGVKRALSSPKRLIGVIFFLGYYWFLFMRPFSSMGSSGSSSGRRRAALEAAGRGVKLPFPNPETLSALVFGGFALITLMLSLGIFSYKATFKAADVDVLFPTPVPPRLVLMFRFVRDTFFTLLTPLFFGFFLYRPAAGPVTGFFRDHPEQSNSILRLGSLAWVLLAFAWTSVGYAISLLSGRDDDGAIRMTRLLRWGLPVFFFTPLVVFGARLYLNPTVDGAIQASHDPIIRSVLFLATSATAVTVPGAGGGFGLAGLLGLVVLIGTAVAAFAYALAQAPYLYDAAASRGGDDKSTVRELARKNDYAGLRSLAAQKGKYKKARLATRFARRTMLGAKAIIWREIVVTLRAGFFGNLVGTFLATIFPPMFLLIGRMGGRSRAVQEFPLYMYLGMSAFMLAILAMGSGNMNFVETLRKVDTTKPLPFAPQKVVGYEVLSKALLPMMLSVTPFVIGFVLRPDAWAFHLTGLLLGPPLVLMVMAVMFLVAILFPDFEDPTQRGFRGMIMLLATACAIVPVFLFPAGAVLLGQPPLYGVPLSLPIAAGIASLALLWSGRLYSDYNPSE